MIDRRPRSTQRGQVLVVFAFGLTGLILLMGLAVDTGFAFSQRRAAQNAADMASLAGARILAEHVAQDPSGTDANVRLAIDTTVAANNGVAITYGAPGGPAYVTTTGTVAGYVGQGTIPATAAGIAVNASVAWRPFFLGILGISRWSAGATATARTGYMGAPPSDGLLPIGVAMANFNAFSVCPPNQTAQQCGPIALTDGTLNVPGGFGWLKYGCYADGGQDTVNGCTNNAGFLQSEIGPPANGFGCCAAIPAGTSDRVGSLPGDKASADLSYYISNHVTVFVPIWQAAHGVGENAYYDVVGFAAFEITWSDGAKNIQGVWRQPIVQGPPTSNPASPGTPLTIQLVR